MSDEVANVGEAEAPAESSSEDQLVEFKADGETHKVPLEELKTLASQGKNYTRRVQELKQKEARVQALMEAEAYFEANPDKRELMEKILRDEEVVMSKEPRQDEAELDEATRIALEIKKEVEGLKSRFEREDQNKATAEFQSQLKAVCGKHKYASEKAVLAAAADPANKHVSLEELAKADHNRVKELIDAGVKEYLEGKKSDAEEVGLGKGASPTQAEKPKDYEKNSRGQKRNVFQKIEARIMDHLAARKDS